MADASPAEWDDLKIWLLSDIGNGRGGDVDLIKESDEWFLGWHGGYPALFFTSPDSGDRFREGFLPYFRSPKQCDPMDEEQELDQGKSR